MTLLDRLDIDILKGIEERDGDFKDCFEQLFKTSFSNDYCRKMLSGIEFYLNYKKGKFETEENKEIDKFGQKTEMLKDGSFKSEKLLHMFKDQEKDPKYMLMAHGFDPKKWTLLSMRNNTWNVYSKQDGVQQLYSSKITAAPKAEEFNLEWFKQQFDKLEKYKPTINKTDLGLNKDKVVEVNLADIHIGLQGLEYEDKLKDMITRIIEDNYDSSHFVLPIGQDFLNANMVTSSSSTTVKGTLLEQKLSYKDMLQSGIRVLHHLISCILHITKATFECIYIPGNHDLMSCFSVFAALQFKYSLDSRAKFDDSVNSRKYRKYGVVGLMLGHGDKEKKNIFKCFSIDAPAIFASTTTREAHLSHLHRESVLDDFGIVFRRMPTVNKADKWHEDSGYVGAHKRIQTFEYCKENGLKSINYYKL